MTKINVKRIYFAHPIRGKTGSPKEIKYHCRMAKAYAAFMRSYLGPGYDIYCPADHDEMPQVAWANGTFITNDILAADLVILRRCQILVAGRWTESRGVDGEVAAARESGLMLCSFKSMEELIMTCELIKEFHG